MWLPFSMFPPTGTHGQWRPGSCLCVFFVHPVDRLSQAGQGRTEETGNRICSGRSRAGFHRRETVLMEELRLEGGGR